MLADTAAMAQSPAHVGGVRGTGEEATRGDHVTTRRDRVQISTDEHCASTRSSRWGR